MQVILVLSLLALLVVLAARPESAGATVRGVVDYRLERVGESDAVENAIVGDMGTLRARWTRIVVDWSKFQPKAPTSADQGYDLAYVEHLKSVCTKLELAGINVIISPYLVPEWASNKALWNSPPSGYDPGYHSFYAMDTTNITWMNAYEEMCRFLAATLGPTGVHHFECGNEPNLYAYQYPQTRPGLAYYGPSTYLKMLKRFHAGIKAGYPGGVVIAGANSPRGHNDKLSTSPQRFAKYLKDHGAAKYFDAYSHHPYVTGGSKSPQPDKPPYSTRTVVTLYNIDQLLRLFPKKPFYLTEYGYSTGDMPQFGYKVTLAQQGTYLQKAYSLAAKHGQIKVMLWYLIKDTASVFTGLQSGDGARKPSWYAFAGGNSLTVSAPRSIRASRAFTLKGVLRVRETGYQAGRRVQLLSRSLSQSAWKTIKATATGSDGSYRFSVKQKATKYYRVRWNGVCTSAKRKVRTP